jgi:transcriptional regulator with XRE-family HTH domain
MEPCVYGRRHGETVLVVLVSEPLARRVGAALRRAREHAAISQEALAEGADVSAHFVSLCETGRRLPSLGVLARFAKTLKADVADLVGQTPPRRSNPAEHEVAVLLGALGEADRAAVIAMLRAFVRARATARRR